MGFVIDGLLAAGVTCGVLWMLSLRTSFVRDTAAARERQQQQEAERARLAREAHLQRQGEPLRCLNCEHRFEGPLPASGCPHCGVASLVVAEADLNEETK